VIFGRGAGLYVTGKSRIEKEKILQQETVNLTTRDLVSNLPSSPSLELYPYDLKAHHFSSVTATSHRSCIYVNTVIQFNFYYQTEHVSRNRPSTSNVAVARGNRQVTFLPTTLSKSDLQRD
jgi:hypothetical protein